MNIKLGLVKNFVKPLNKEGQALANFKSNLVNLSFAKIKEGVFADPEIKKCSKTNNLKHILSLGEAAAWNSFRLIVSDFLENNKSPNY